MNSSQISLSESLFEESDDEPAITPSPLVTRSAVAARELTTLVSPYSDRIIKQGVCESARCLSHFGEGCQGPLQHDRRIKTIVITLPHPGLWARVTCELQEGRGRVIVSEELTKLRLAVQELLTRSRRHDVDVRLKVWSNIPVGIGAGSSSASVFAGLRAVAQALRLRLSDVDMARFAFLGEGPTDPLSMLAWGVTPVWASRLGELVEIIPKPIPSLACVGVVGSPSAVSTTMQANDTSYDPAEIRAFAKIYSRVNRAIQRQAADDFVRACGDSLELNQHRCPTPRLDELRQIAAEVGALGVLASHSGTAAVIAFDANSEGYKGAQQAALREVRSRGFSFTHCFNTP